MESEGRLKYATKFSFAKFALNYYEKAHNRSIKLNHTASAPKMQKTNQQGTGQKVRKTASNTLHKSAQVKSNELLTSERDTLPLLYKKDKFRSANRDSEAKRFISIERIQSLAKSISMAIFPLSAQ
jgi:hypothetical protein